MVESNGDSCRINRLVVVTLAAVLLVALGAEIALGAASWWRAAGDPAGTNAVHDEIKTVITFVLGSFAGIVQARILGGLGHSQAVGA